MYIYSFFLCAIGLYVNAINEAETTIPYQNVFRSLPTSAVVLVSADLTILDANDHYFSLTGNSRDFVIGKTTNDIATELTGDDVTYQTMKAAFNRVLTDLVHDSYDFIDINQRVWHTEIHPIFLTQGTEVGANGKKLALMICHVTDQTQLYHEKRVQHIIRQQMQSVDNYRRLVNAVRAYAIFMVDEHGKIGHWNQGATEITQWTEIEVLGKNVEMFYSAEDIANIQAQMQDLTLETSVFLQGKIPKKDGSLFPADTTITPIASGMEEYNDDTALADQPQKTIGFAFVVRDLTQDLAAQEALKKVYEEAAILKDEFTSRCSHDIRNPLNAISLAVDALYATAMTAEQTELVYLIKRSLKKQLIHVNEILDFGKLTAPGRKLSLHLQPTDLIQYLSVEMEDFKLIAPQEISVEFHHPESLPCYMVDQNKLTQITSNLISNALKFTQKGYIKLTITVHEPHELDMDQVSFVFSDSGRGVSEEGLKTLFVPYSQIDGSNTQRNRGSGLGLSIVKIVVENMGGRVFMTSEGLGKGTQVTVQLPLLRSARRPRLIRTPTSTLDVLVVGDGTQPILIAEDDDMNRVLLVRGLSRLGYSNIHEAKNGQELVQMACPTHEYEIIISDVQMPLLSGVDATRHIRTYDTFTPIIALTADGTKSTIDQCRAAGMTHVLVKPARIKTIGKMIAELLIK